MITLTRITDPASSEYRFTEELLTATFPREEYRELHEQRNNVASKKAFHLMLAKDGDKTVGFISYWELGGYCYVEHLATLPTVRGGGYGSAILEELKKRAQRIVLEVEEPTDEITTRRINFYRRAGFEICPLQYMQPPYRKGDGTLPMRLMFHGCNADSENFNRAKEIIYNNIYNYKE
ncbi:MAG: GNAT family N-acetyltransferase [Bacteroidaceae bacterium]|nr:GNAT family N-acetyltransferase [Bacteroidaceae bacterium]